MRKDYAATILAKGNIGEECLNAWFLENGFSFLQVSQSHQNFAHPFANTIKRPDFILILESIAMLAVDAKNCLLSCGYFTLSLKEVQRALAFEILSHLPFWFAYLHRGENGLSWYWISALRALEVGLRRTNGRTNEEFLALSVKEFIPICIPEDIGRLYAQRLPPTRRILDMYGQ